MVNECGRKESFSLFMSGDNSFAKYILEMSNQLG